MKAHTFLSLILYYGSVLIAHGQSNDGTYMVEAIAKTFTKGKILQEISSYGFDDNVCLLGAFIKKSNVVTWSTYLEYGKKYALIGGGDKDAKDLDITVRNSSGEIVVQDGKIDANPVVLWTASSTGKYTFELKLYNCNTNGSFCALAIMEQYANKIPSSNLTQSLSKSFAMWEGAEGVYNIKFHDKANQWCLFGMVLESGKSQTITNLDLDTLSHLFISTGDSNVDDIDLCLLNSNSSAIKCDEADDANPVVRYQTSNSFYYGLKTKNISSSGLSFIITSILTDN
jgi:hypothetical protein